MPYLLFTLIISIIVAVFAVQNAADVTVGFLMWTVQTSLVVVILGAALLGALAMGFFTLMLKAKHYLYNKSLKFEIDQLKKRKCQIKRRKRNAYAQPAQIKNWKNLRKKLLAKHEET